MADNFPYWPPGFIQDFHAIPGRQVNNGLSMLNIDSLIPQFRETEIPIVAKAPIYKQSPDSAGYAPVYGNVKSDLFAHMNASLTNAPESQVGNASARGGNNG